MNAIRLQSVFAANLMLGLFLCLGAPAVAGSRPPALVIVEGGLAVPYGTLGESFEKTRLGFGAGDGWVAGFRFRYHLSPTVSVSPSFDFVDFGNYKGNQADVGDFQVMTSSLRYSLEFMVMSEYQSFGKPRPFLGMGIGMFRNRAQGFYQDFVEAIDESVSSLGVSFRGGVQIIGFELSLVYSVNRFNTWRLYRSDYRERYNWDSLQLRAGWIIPLE